MYLVSDWKNVHVPSPTRDSFNSSSRSWSCCCESVDSLSLYFCHSIPNSMRGYLLYKGSFFLLFLHTVKPERKNCIVCQALKGNPCAQCLCLDIPRQILNHMRAQPLILAKCWSLFVQGHQRYFEIITRKGLHTRWVIRGPLFLLFLLTLPFAVILLLLASLLLLCIGFFETVPQCVILRSCWQVFFPRLYMSSLFVRLPALKWCVELINTVVDLLTLIGGSYLLVHAFLGILLTILLAFVMALIFHFLMKVSPLWPVFVFSVTT